MLFTLPNLAYAYDALEPIIDKETMELHYSKHHQAYVTGLNNAVSTLPQKFSNWSLEDLLKKIDELPETAHKGVRNMGGGHANHSLFWTILNKSPSPLTQGALLDNIVQKYSSLDNLEKEVRQTALTVFGSGWVWLVWVPQSNELKVYGLPNQDSPFMHHHIPLMGIDVWEHAYYLKYQNRRAEYLDAILKIVDWNLVSRFFDENR